MITVQTWGLLIFVIASLIRNCQHSVIVIWATIAAVPAITTVTTQAWLLSKVLSPSRLALRWFFVHPLADWNNVSQCRVVVTRACVRVPARAV